MVDIETEFLFDSWYVAGWSSDFEHALTPLTILGEQIVIFRTDKGTSGIIGMDALTRSFESFLSPRARFLNTPPRRR